MNRLLLISTNRGSITTKFRQNPEAMREAVSQYIAEGFNAVKCGLGVFGRNGRHDVKLVEAARSALGHDGDLLVDTGWFVERTPKEATQVIRSIEAFRPFLVEELLHPEEYDGYPQVSTVVETCIACGEQQATEWGFAQLRECGGFTVARRIGAYG